jgi:adenylate cyclase
MIEHPDTVRFEGEVRELTVVFTDLTDFTALSEKLGEATVPVLNRYFDCMVPVIRKHRGRGTKFLGDGIMFFFGAPLPNEDHAADAVATVLEMRKVLAQFNGQLAAEGLAPLEMRAGISTGKVVVGDAGSADASDYTVLGDAVNVGSRLESAGKITGTRNVISGRTVELLGERFLVRLVGKLQVAGKSQPVLTYEALCESVDATTDEKLLAELTGEMVHAYFDSRFERCLATIDRLEGQFGEETLTRLYRHLCQRHQSEPPAEAFAGQIVLAEK